MKVKINGKEVDVELTEETNHLGDEDVAVSLRVNGWYILEITKAGKLRRCDFGCNESNGLNADRSGHGKIMLEKGY
jgi:hypothetical protein